MRHPTFLCTPPYVTVYRLSVFYLIQLLHIYLITIHATLYHFGNATFCHHTTSPTTEPRPITTSSTKQTEGAIYTSSSMVAAFPLFDPMVRN